MGAVSRKRTPASERLPRLSLVHFSCGLTIAEYTMRSITSKAIRRLPLRIVGFPQVKHDQAHHCLIFDAFPSLSEACGKYSDSRMLSIVMSSDTPGVNSGMFVRVRCFGNCKTIDLRIADTVPLGR